jgi:threonine dehydrogenase-like Zn-dependent dehydrogenase
VKQSAYLATDRLHVLRQAIQACRKGGSLSIPGVYGGFLDKVPFGAAFAKGLTMAMGQTHVHRYLPRLIEQVEEGFDPAHIVSHHGTLEDAPHFYELFGDRAQGCTKVVLTP